MSTPNQTNGKFSISLQPTGRRTQADKKTSIRDAALSAGVEIVSLCGGVGSCDSCKVRLVKGTLTELTLEEQVLFDEEELETGYRLACQAYPLSDVVIDIPPESLTTPQRLQVEGMGAEVSLDPVVIPLELRLEPPTLTDLRSDITRLRDALAKVSGKAWKNGTPHISYPLLQALPALFRQHDWAVRLGLRGDEIASAFPPTQPKTIPIPLLGLAVDIGTTKLAAYLVNIENGQIIAKTGEMNPQIAFGEDVVSRIAYANANPDGRQVLQERLADTLNQMVLQMCQSVQEGIQAAPEQVVEAVIVGNTAMHHLFAGLAVTQLGASPYVPAVSDAIDIPASAIGLDLAAAATIHLPPNIAGYVGADHVAMLMAALIDPKTGAPPPDRTIVALDIGTNTEITLSHNGRMVSCSCASGPAFEGAHIRDGMRAAPGAVERVQIAGDEVRIQTIGEQPPVGICGSGILDVVAQMLLSDVIDYRGVIRQGHPAVQSRDERLAFILSPAANNGHHRDVYVNRKDVNEIQLAKGAIRAGINILLQESGLQGNPMAIDEFIVAGAFGTYINIESAIQIGMFPDIPLERYRQVGNAAGAGARQMLISGHHRRQASQVVEQIEYVELSAHPDFLPTFSEALYFPEH